jgi:hypothetical protein
MVKWRFEMNKFIRTFTVVLSLSTAACVNPYTGQIDPVATTAAVGAVAVGAGVLGYAAGQNSAPQHYHYNPPVQYYNPRHYYYNRHYYNPHYRRWR